MPDIRTDPINRTLVVTLDYSEAEAWADALEEAYPLPDVGFHDAQALRNQAQDLYALERNR